jgi:hypothetical protein
MNNLLLVDQGPDFHAGRLELQVCFGQLQPGLYVQREDFKVSPSEELARKTLRLKTTVSPLSLSHLEEGDGPSC